MISRRVNSYAEQSAKTKCHEDRDGGGGTSYSSAYSRSHRQTPTFIIHTDPPTRHFKGMASLFSSCLVTRVSEVSLLNEALPNTEQMSAPAGGNIYRQ